MGVDLLVAPEARRSDHVHRAIARACLGGGDRGDQPHLYYRVVDGFARVQTRADLGNNQRDALHDQRRNPGRFLLCPGGLGFFDDPIHDRISTIRADNFRFGSGSMLFLHGLERITARPETKKAGRESPGLTRGNYQRLRVV